MSNQFFDEEKCNRRRRIAALRDGVDAAPVRLFRGIGSSSGLKAPEGWEGRLRFSDGDLPLNLDDALFRINLSLSGSGSLTENDVYVHYLEAANTNFIGDRYMFLDSSTLRNVARNAESGFAFMNSHRTGGLSAPSELPFGRTFSGRYEEYEKGGETFKRSVLGVYMLRGQKPNGEAGPSTDDLHRGIEAGTISDVSMGLVGGTRLCDVCGVDLSGRGSNGRYLCPHAPGTHKEMTEEHIEAQKNRGVPDGKASYSVVDATPQEVSAVYKGAVPGAGFRKAMAFGRNGSAFGRTRDIVKFGPEILSAYGQLMSDQERSIFKTDQPQSKGSSKMDAMSFFRFWKAAGEPETIDFSALESLPIIDQSVNRGSHETPKVDPVKLANLEAREAEIVKREREIKAMEFGVQADGYVLGLEKSHKITPAETPSVRLGYVLAALDDFERPATDPTNGNPVKRLDVFKASHADRTPIRLMKEEAEASELLPSGDEPSDPDKPTAERLAELLKSSTLGQKTMNDLAASLKK